MLAYSVPTVGDQADTTLYARRGLSTGQPMKFINNQYKRKRFQQGPSFTTHSGTGSANADSNPLEQQLNDPRDVGPEGSQQLENREHRDIVIVWVDWSFQKAVSSCDNATTILSIWEQAFSVIAEIARSGILHRDLSFQNMRVDNQHHVKLCDFDMALRCSDLSSGAVDRTGTLPFMSIAVLGDTPTIHRAIHDYESVLWLCALSLLTEIGIGIVQNWVTSIFSRGLDIHSALSAKVSLVGDISSMKGLEPALIKSHVSLLSPKHCILFSCLTRLMGHFSANRPTLNYALVQDKEGNSPEFFNKCIRLIQENL